MTLQVVIRIPERAKKLVKLLTTGQLHRTQNMLLFYICTDCHYTVVPRETVIVDRQCSVSISTQKNSISKTKVDIANHIGILD